MTQRRVIALGVAVMGVPVLLCGAALTVLAHPAPLFPVRIEHGAFTVLAQRDPGDALRRVLDDVSAAVAASGNDAAMRHEIVFADGNAVYGAVQGLRWWAVRALGGPVRALTFHETGISWTSRVVTFRVPDAAGDVLVDSAGGGTVRLTRTLAHEVGHGLLRARVGPAALRLPLWKQEGWAERVASFVGVGADPAGSFRRGAERLRDLAAAEDPGLELRPGCQERSSLVLEDGDRWPTCYFVSRVLMQYLLDVRGLSLEEALRPELDDRGALDEVLAWLEGEEPES